MPATNSNEAQQPADQTVAYRRRLMPWSSCRVPKKFRGEQHLQMDMWDDLAACLLGELISLREQDPFLAFERLMVVRKAFRAGFYPSPWSYESDDPVVKGIPDFLRAIAANESDNLVHDLYAALTHQVLDVSTVPADLFDPLSVSSRAALRDRLLAIDPESKEGVRLGPVLSQLLLSDPDIDRLIETLDELDLWGFVSAAKAVDRLMTEDRYPSNFLILVLRAVQGDAADRGVAPDSESRAFPPRPAPLPPSREDLLDRVLTFCEAHGKRVTAQGLRQSMSHQWLSVRYARDYLSNIASKKKAKVEEEHILVRVRSDSRRGQALLFLLEWPSIEDAIRLARSQHDEMNDIEGWQLKKASEQLEDVAPDAALKLYRKSDNIRRPLDNVVELWFGGSAGAR